MSSLSVLVLANETRADSSAAFVIASEQRRYLVNCGEGTQRLCAEHGVKLSRLTHVLLTSTAWHCVGGVPGALLTVADAGVSTLRLTAPRGFARTLIAARAFLHRTRLTVDLQLYAKTPANRSGFERPLVDDGTLTVYAVPLLDAPTRPRHCAHTLPLSAAPLLQLRAHCDCAAAAERDEQRSVALVVHGADIPGKFDAARATALGVPAGPLRGALVRGDTVTSPGTGQPVAPADCILPATPGRVAVLCTARSPLDVQSLLASVELARRYHAGGALADRVVVVLHTAPRDLFVSAAYSEWRAAFAPAVEHRWVHADAGALCRQPPFVESALYQHALHAVAPVIFRAYAGDGEAAALALLAPAERAAQERCDVERVAVGAMLSRFVLAPMRRVGYEPGTAWLAVDARSAKQHKFADMRSSQSRVPEHDERHARVKALLQHMHGDALAPLLATESTLRADNPAVTFLGTGSALPSRCRNVTCILLRLSPQHSMFLDCGEGSLGQLRRALDGDACAAALRSLCCIAISHRHPDHHLGLESLLLARRELAGAAAPPLLVVAPRDMAEWLAQLAEPIEFVPCDELAFGAPRSGPLRARVAARCGVESFDTVEVTHIGDSHGVVLRHARWSLAFSGDTTPCAAFVEAARDVTVLIHEATLEDGMEADALVKNHSTTSQALQVASDARAQFLVLTHFSQRYPKIPSLPATALAKHVVVSFDLMTVFFDQLSALPLLTPVLTELLEEAHDAAGDDDDDNDDGDNDNAEQVAKKPRGAV
jgi:ribonuclease Z